MKIRVGDPVSWKIEGVRTFGHVKRAGNGFYMVEAEGGLRMAVRARDITKEGP